ncbi:MAG: N-acetylmuramoyl-L-alanine amidase [Syntrophobacterales bacterium]|jgi:N-acetylmuramoyl-L-alanine amidase
MTNKDWLIGNLLADGRLETQSGAVQLTTLPRGAPEPPESGALPVAKENVGKMVLAQGDLVGKVLFKAQVVEILPRLTGALMQMLVEKEIVSMAEIKAHLAELEDREEEITEPKKLCALVIGHKKSSPGAGNAKAKIHEFEFNDDLAIRIEKKTQNTRIQRVYRRTYEELPGDINGLDPDFVLSLHCNSYNGRASGTEVLYYHRSKIGEGIAKILQNHLVEFLGLRDRGIKRKTSEERGGYLLRYTNAPCVIAEPFFIDNDEDLARARDDLEGLAGAYASAIDAIAQAV